MNLDITKQLEDKRFFKLYEELYQDPYKKLSNNDRCIYSLLVNRMNLSVTRANWIDEEGAFIKYTQSKLAEDLCLTRPTVAKSLNNLEEYKLIKVIQLGANLPNKIYVYPPVNIQCKETLQQDNGCKENLHSMQKNFTVDVKEFDTHCKDSLHEKDLYKTNLKDIYNTNNNINNNINANANNKNNKHKTNYNSNNEWLYNSYIAFNNLKDITNNTDYYWLNKLIEDMDDEDQLIKYYFYIHPTCKGESKNAKWLYKAIMSWKGKSIHQIEYETKQYFDTKHQQQLNAKYGKINANNYDVYKSDEDIKRDKQHSESIKRMHERRRKQQQPKSDNILDLVDEIFDFTEDNVTESVSVIEENTESTDNIVYWGTDNTIESNITSPEATETLINVINESDDVIVPATTETLETQLNTVSDEVIEPLPDDKLPASLRFTGEMFSKNYL